jgi:N-acetylmuramoyl-L-alanine amidase CwlA
MRDVRVHYYVDDICAWQCLPDDYVNWSCADGCANPNSGNNTSVAIEVIGNSGKAEANAVKLVAYLLNKYNLYVTNGLRTHTYWLNVKDGKTGTIDYLNTAHNSYKNCPIYILPHWGTFKANVISALAALKTPTPTPTAITTEMYRIRKSWGNAAS